MNKENFIICLKTPYTHEIKWVSRKNYRKTNWSSKTLILHKNLESEDLHNKKRLRNFYVEKNVNNDFKYKNYNELFIKTENFTYKLKEVL